MAVQKITTGAISDDAITSDKLGDNLEISGTSHMKVPVGTTAQRPETAAVGQLRYNTTTGYFETYSSSGWGSIATPPSITTVSPSTFNGESGTTFTINGSFFDSSAVVKFITNSGTEYSAGTVTYVNSGQLTATTPQDFTVADEPLDVKIINGSGLSTIAENVIDCGATPTFTTSSGSLGTIYDSQRSSYTLSTAAATDPDTSATITYSIISGSIPSGMSFNTSTAAITGTPNAVGSDTTSTFTVRATDNAGNTNDRQFSIAVKAPVITTYTTVGSGTFSVPSGVTSVWVVAVAGGGGGSHRHGGGGGAGGMIDMPSFPVTPGGTVSYTLGGGGAGAGPGGNDANKGSDTTFGGLTAKGGGQAFSDNPGGDNSGGSGGGGPGPANGSNFGTGTQPSQPGNSGTYGYGYPGGRGYPSPGAGGGGGGAGAVGGDATGGGYVAGAGGSGRSTTISGSPVYYAGGGGGGFRGPGSGTSGRPGGTGGGGNSAPGNGQSGNPGTTNTGGGGGGGSEAIPGTGGNGGPGIIIVKY